MSGNRYRGSVSDNVYKSAVKGRQDFRTALRECRAENETLKETLNTITKQKNRLFKGMELYTTKENIEKYLAHYQILEGERNQTSDTSPQRKSVQEVKQIEGKLNGN